MQKIPEGTDSSGDLGGGWTVEPEPSVTHTDAPEARSRPAESETSTLEAEPAVDELSAPQVSNAAIVMLGVFGGLFLLYTWGWFVVARAYSIVNAATAEGSGLIGGIFQQIVFWAAPFAPLTWFLASVVLARKRPKLLAALLLIGAILLLPLPMIGGGS